MATHRLYSDAKEKAAMRVKIKKQLFEPRKPTSPVFNTCLQSMEEI